MMLSPGTRLDDLVVDRIIGEGSHAAIYKVRHDDGSRAALKVLHTTEPLATSRLLREGKVLASLDHPNVVKLFRAMEVDGRPALLMELIVGPTLGDWLDAGGARGVDEAMDVFRGIARGVQAVHAAGVVHRDLNPGNVLLAISSSKRVVPKIADFGLVRVHTEPGLSSPGPLGTPAYMAPEQIANGRDAGPPADLFALGCILYELLTHERAFQGSDELTLYEAARSRGYLPVQTITPEVPDDVANIVHQLLSPDPAQRPESVAMLLEALYLDDVPEITMDERPEVFSQWSEVRVSTATAAKVRELSPAGTVPVVQRATAPPLPAGPQVLAFVALGALSALLGVAAAWWLLS